MTRPEIPHPPFIERMKRFHGQIEQAVYAAEITCAGSDCPDDCPFATFDGGHCDLKYLRDILGDPVKQHDPTVEAAALEDIVAMERGLPKAMPEGGTDVMK